MDQLRLQRLAQIPLFTNLSEQERAEVLELMVECRFEPGQTVMQPGEAGDAFYTILNGQAQIWLIDSDGKKVVLDELGPGKFFGELSMLSGDSRSAGVSVTSEATEQLITLELGRDEFFDFLRRRPEAAVAVLQELGKRLKHTDDILRTRVSRNANEVDEVGMSLGQRVADVIAEFSGSIAFLLINLVLFVVWIGLNTLGPEGWHFDAYPFQFLTMSVSLEAIFLSIFVLISQNRQAAKDRLKTELDYEVNVKAELELSELSGKLRELERSLQHIHNDVMEVKLTTATATKASANGREP